MNEIQTRRPWTPVDAIGLQRVEAQLNRLEALMSSIANRLGVLPEDEPARRGRKRKRTDEDKRRAVETALADEERKSWSDGKIAMWCGVRRELVERVRAVPATSP